MIGSALAPLGHAPEPFGEIEQLAPHFGQLALRRQLVDLGGDASIIFGARPMVAHLVAPDIAGTAECGIARP
jgi:hypothetical protein